jgi:hypothetical protein
VLPDAYDQKSLQNEILLSRGAATYYNGKGVATGDNNFDTKFSKLHGRPLGFFIGTVPSDEELANQRKRGRPGATGGFNAGPARPSAANRYSGSQRFAFGSVNITPENRSSHIRIARPGTINELVEGYPQEDPKNSDANYAAVAEQVTAMPMSSGVEGFIDLSSIFGHKVYISADYANTIKNSFNPINPASDVVNNLENLEKIKNFFFNISEEAREKSDEAKETVRSLRSEGTFSTEGKNEAVSKYEEIESYYSKIATDSGNMARGIGALQNSKKGNSECTGQCAEAEKQLEKYNDIFTNFNFNK